MADSLTRVDGKTGAVIWSTCLPIHPETLSVDARGAVTMVGEMRSLALVQATPGAYASPGGTAGSPCSASIRPEPRQSGLQRLRGTYTVITEPQGHGPRSVPMVRYMAQRRSRRPICRQRKRPYGSAEQGKRQAILLPVSADHRAVDVTISTMPLSPALPWTRRVASLWGAPAVRFFSATSIRSRPQGASQLLAIGKGKRSGWAGSIRPLPDSGMLPCSGNWRSGGSH